MKYNFIVIALILFININSYPASVNDTNWENISPLIEKWFKCFETREKFYQFDLLVEPDFEIAFPDATLKGRKELHHWLKLYYKNLKNVTHNISFESCKQIKKDYYFVTLKVKVQASSSFGKIMNLSIVQEWYIKINPFTGVRIHKMKCGFDKKVESDGNRK